MMRRRKWLLTVFVALGVLALAGLFAAADAAEKKARIVIPQCSS